MCRSKVWISRSAGLSKGGFIEKEEAMYKALYRAYRPEVFGDVLGQEAVVRILKNQVTAGEVSHAYLFCGTRGTGKTTIARLLAKAVNCTGEGERPCGHCDNCRAIAAGSFIDLIEIDAASNNGVDNIRELRESVNYPPAVGRRKVYIMDEVHMLSSGAYNALLKTLEEPPENVMFILCTTEPEKLPATVLSRCVRMDFRRVSEEDIKGRLSRICQDRGLAVEESGLALIAAAADGSVRDGLSILEQCISGRQGTVGREDVLDAIGTVGEEDFLALTEAVAQRRVADGLLLIEEMLQKGRDARQILQGWMAHYRNLLLVKYLEDPANAMSMSLENLERVHAQADLMEPRTIAEAIGELSAVTFEAKRSTQPRVLLEMVFVKLATENGQFAPAPKANPAAQTKPDLTPETQAVSAQAPQAAPAGDAAARDPVAPAQAPQTDLNGGIDLTALWEAFLDRGESTIGTRFFFVRGRSTPLSLEDGVLKVRVTGAAKQYMEENRNALSAMLSEVVGRTTLLYPVADEEVPQDEPAPFGAPPEEDAEEELRSRVQNALGIDVQWK